MSLTLNLISKTLMSPQVPSLTVFSPLGDSFAQFGQPPLSLLQFHFSPHALSLDTLRSLPHGAKISTMNANHSLMVTTSPSDYQVETNGVKIVSLPVFNDGNLVFQTSALAQSPVLGLECVAPRYGGLEDLSGGNVFGQACGTMRSKGYFVMASFLGLQLMKLKGNIRSMANHTGSFSEYPSLFLRHVIPCKLLSKQTHLEGFVIEVTIIGDHLMDWLSVHGALDVIAAREGRQPGMEVSSKSGRV
ncbi:hypothetical protein ACJRO7_028286 [Eucalyptus globulus]|uniref:FAS1 domain-containing protein n=1 Tax=Eucalyptus globulus TaxID=34317 RepID=A0ABD3JYZ2_EUCGL